MRPNISRKRSSTEREGARKRIVCRSTTASDYIEAAQRTALAAKHRNCIYEVKLRYEF